MKAQPNYASMPGPGDLRIGRATRRPSLCNFDGPTFREGHDVPCHVCDASGVIEDGEQVDVDVFLDCLCGNCDGSGIEPWRAAGERNTGNPSRDGLTYPRRGHWSETQVRARSLSGRSLAALAVAEANIRQRIHPIFQAVLAPFRRAA